MLLICRAGEGEGKGEGEEKKKKGREKKGRKGEGEERKKKEVRSCWGRRKGEREKGRKEKKRWENFFHFFSKGLHVLIFFFCHLKINFGMGNQPKRCFRCCCCCCCCSGGFDFFFLLGFMILPLSRKGEKQTKKKMQRLAKTSKGAALCQKPRTKGICMDFTYKSKQKLSDLLFLDF